jgi:uncharacterized membrane protein YeaQ/YmgE (transglycosylase-associated protein family)
MLEYRTVRETESWQAGCWPVSWSAVWVGTLTAIATGLVIGLIGLAIGAYTFGAEARIASWHKFHFAALVWSVGGAFFSYVVGGWAAAKIRAEWRAETAILHGVVAWLVSVPIMLLFASLGSANYFGVWYGGLQGTPVWITPSTIAVDPTAAMVARNMALGAVSALLVGLVGSVIGGWLGSGEPMTLTYRRAQEAVGAHS